MNAKKVSHEQALRAHGWVALDAADIGLIEAVYKKTIRDGEERLMLAVLESAVEDFQQVRPRTEASREAAISTLRGLVSRER